MDTHNFHSDVISFRVWKNILKKFYLNYNQVQLRDYCYSRVPVFVRYNNRNVYGVVSYFDGRFSVDNLYRLNRDGSPVKYFVNLECNFVDPED